MNIIICTIYHKEVGIVAQAIGVEGWREQNDIIAEAEEIADVQNVENLKDYILDIREHEL